MIVEHDYVFNGSDDNDSVTIVTTKAVQRLILAHGIDTAVFVDSNGFVTAITNEERELIETGVYQITTGA